MSVEIGHETVEPFGVLIEKKVCLEELTDNEIPEITNAIIVKKFQIFNCHLSQWWYIFKTWVFKKLQNGQKSWCYLVIFWILEWFLVQKLIDAQLVELGDKLSFVLMSITHAAEKRCHHWLITMMGWSFLILIKYHSSLNLTINLILRNLENSSKK